MIDDLMNYDKNGKVQGWDGYLSAWVCELFGKAYGRFLDAGIGYRFRLLVGQF